MFMFIINRKAFGGDMHGQASENLSIYIHFTYLPVALIRALNIKKGWTFIIFWGKTDLLFSL